MCLTIYVSDYTSNYETNYLQHAEAVLDILFLLQKV